MIIVIRLAELHPEMRKKELIDTLIALLNPEELPEVQDEAAFALANLAKDCKFFKLPSLPAWG
jgi:hypothetical protein